MTASTMPERVGSRPEVIGPAPHAQRSQNAPAALQQELVRRARELPGVREADSEVSVPGARAFVLDEATADRMRRSWSGASSPTSTLPRMGAFT